MTTAGPVGRDRAVALLLGVGLVGAVFALGSVFEPTDLVGLAALYGTYLAAFVAVALLLVELYVPSFDDEALESDERAPTVDWDGDWGVSGVEIATAVGVAALLALGGRASLALGTVATVAFVPLAVGVGGAAGWWLYAPENGRATPDEDHPFTSASGVARRQLQIFGNLVTWATVAILAVRVGDATPIEVAGRAVERPALAVAAAALLGFAVTHWLLTRPLLGD